MIGEVTVLSMEYTILVSRREPARTKSAPWPSSAIKRDFVEAFQDDHELEHR